MLLKIIDLEPNDGRKSFYGKAKAIRYNDKIALLSYSTIVCTYDYKTKKLRRHYKDYSNTTRRHIISFCEYLKIDIISNKDYEKIRLTKVIKPFDTL